MAIKQALDESHFSGLSMANSSVPDAQKVLWSDLVQGKPELEDTLSTNAKQMKSEMYSSMFKDSTDLDHACFVSGSTYLRCLQDNYKELSQGRRMKCLPTFTAFDACRKDMQAKQAGSVETSLVRQDIADKRAKALFERRSVLLDTLTH